MALIHFDIATAVLKLFVIILVGIPTSRALQCYVCGRLGDGIDCDNSNPTNTIYIQECPPHSNKSCGIQTDGNRVTRTCENHDIHDCQTANKVQYCYCLRDLCNGKDINISDDEDLLTEGSGGAPAIDPKRNNQVIPMSENENTNSSGHMRLAFNISYLILFTLMML